MKTWTRCGKVTPEDVNRVAKQYLVDDNSITAELKPVPSGAAVASKGFGGGEQSTSAPTKAVDLPPWAGSRLLALEMPPAPPSSTDMTLPNGLRLIVRTLKITPTITVVGSVRNQPELETAPGKDGVNNVLDDMFSYGTKNLDRLAFQKALDDIAADESAGFSFSLQVLKQDFSRGVQLLADNELNPALPAEAFDVIKPQTAQFVAGRMKSPGYRAGRALNDGVASGGRSGPSGNDSADGFVIDAGRREAVLRQDDTARSDDDRGDRRHHARRSQERDREMVWSMEGSGSQARRGPSRRAPEQVFRGQRARSQRAAGFMLICRKRFPSRDSIPITTLCNLPTTFWAAASTPRVCIMTCGR